MSIFLESMLTALAIVDLSLDWAARQIVTGKGGATLEDVQQFMLRICDSVRQVVQLGS